MKQVGHLVHKDNASYATIYTRMGLLTKESVDYVLWHISPYRLFNT